ncbi:hypothetical protein GGC47_003178 [Bosea sp. OAE752]|uniref:hypothetical protein n=1 Tax=Bosea sp. OAE752 TaxID=2663873 RepID=UPI003D1932BA
MLKTAIIGAMAGMGAFAAVLVGGRTTSVAAEEIRCRVNVPAFLSELHAINDVNADLIKNVLKPKP